MCKANDTITAKVADLLSLRRMADELQAEIDALTDDIKAYMGDEDTMSTDQWKITYKPVTQQRLDTTALKKAYGDALNAYYKTITTRPFKVTA